MNRICLDCNLNKPIDEFFYRKDTNNYHSYCKMCHSVRNKIAGKKYQNSKKGKEKIKQINEKRRILVNSDVYLLEKYREYSKIYQRKYRKTDKGRELSKARDMRRRENPTYRLNSNVSRRIRKSLEENKSGRRWEEFVGYTLADLIIHLEKQFNKHINWNNYGSYWHIDHIKPLAFSSNFNKEYWQLDNLRPLESKANIRKKDKWEISPNVFIKLRK